MSEDPLFQPHDKLFKWSYGQPETAAAAIQAYLPARLTRHLALARAELVSGSFIDEQLKGRESDVLFRVPHRAKDLLVYFLLEQQSRTDRWMAQRLLRYMNRIWDRFRSEQPQAVSLPVIVSVVVAQQPWGRRDDTSFGALFDLDAEERADFARAIPDFSFTLIELAKLPWDQLVGTDMGVMTFRLLKAQPRKALLSDEVWDEPLLARLTPQNRHAALRYILAQGEVDREGFARRVEHLREAELRHDAMTLAEQFIQEGLEKGLEQGLEKGFERGREQGMLIGRIQSLQDILGHPETPTGQLAGRSLDELQALLEQLRHEPR